METLRVSFRNQHLYVTHTSLVLSSAVNTKGTVKPSQFCLLTALLFTTRTPIAYLTVQLWVSADLTVLVQLNLRNLLPNYGRFLLKLPVRVQHTCAVSR